MAAMRTHAEDVELTPTGVDANDTNNQHSIFQSPGFARPRRVPLYAARRILMRLGLDGKVLTWEEVQSILDMSKQALDAKSTAIEELHEHLARAQEQLLCEQEAYAKIIQEEKALEADSGWLRQHIQGLLQEKRTLQEEVERLKTANSFLLQERDLLFEQLEVDTSPDDDDDPVTLTAAVASKIAHEHALQQQLHDSNTNLQRQVQRLQEQLAHQQSQHAIREGQLLACLSQTTRAHYEALQSINQAQANTRQPLTPETLSRGLTHVLSLGKMAVEGEVGVEGGVGEGGDMSSLGSEGTSASGGGSAWEEGVGVVGGVRHMDSVSEVEVSEVHQLHTLSSPLHEPLCNTISNTISNTMTTPVPDT